MSNKTPQYKSFEEPKKRVPKRVLHFSDGILEEYSTDEEEREERKREEEQQKSAQTTAVNTSEMSWISWAMYLMMLSATNTLSVCDSVGERLAWWLGITSPKYYYEIQEAKRMMKEQEERKSRMDAEMAGWVGDTNTGEGGLVRSQEDVRGKERGTE
eukprot:TRINITY_DN59803_c0_g1_i1.p1 TRINITY_DN59803_c0_g1~~TRINITY_DN59803_c0_g1_i1.p1  ORF type:complete len:157 (+),score=48.05 TRINITY_DN59803_c0_g1_i1:3-473(+)